MPRKYIKKRDPPAYTLEDLARAVDHVKAKKLTYRAASEFYGIPVSVIYNRINGRKVSINKMGAGVSLAIPINVENHIVACLKTRAKNRLSLR